MYRDLLNAKKTAKTVQAALNAIDDYVAQRAAKLFGPVIDHLRDVGEGALLYRDRESLWAEFRFIHGVTTACEYLADQGLIGKASTPVRITKKSNIAVQELAFSIWRSPLDGR